ncbi:MAG: ribosome biogenesis GTP-binding protein YihA/YsxC [Acidimicrobiales bacterium]|nr:ribosome biogenesis GTP-binding protein YihA/YsxC [Acidimicrobiales bacterium]
MSAPLQLEFLTSADDLDRLPPTPAEVAVVGRSNVGKSSLLNAVANRNQLARTSKTPGRTQLLNCFALRDGGTVVDCPGYGYAKAPKHVRAGFGPMIEDYLLDRDELVMIAVLVDGEIGPTKLDVQLLEWLRANGLPHTVIATKHDKVKSSARDRRKRDLAHGCGLDVADVVWVSAAKGVNVDRVRDLFRLWLA